MSLKLFFEELKADFKTAETAKIDPFFMKPEVKSEPSALHQNYNGMRIRRISESKAKDIEQKLI